MTRPRDVLIVGGGPAGSAAAIILARGGRDVLLVERAVRHAPRVGESLPSGSKGLLHALGVADLMGADGHLTSPGTVSAWGGARPYCNDFVFDPDGDGWHL